ncbi:MAG: polysaccharide biosynthesis C-terminal domain-containing protein [Candidatus Methylomirabilales bacterium]
MTLILAGACAVSVAQTPAGYVLMLKGRHRQLAGIALAGSLTNIALSLVLVRPLGIVGVALGTALPALLTDAGLFVPLACRLVGLPVRRLLRESVLPAAVPALFAYVPAAWAAGLPALQSLPGSLLGMGATALLYLALFAGLGLGAADRRRYLQHLRAAMPAHAAAVAKPAPAAARPGGRRAG